MRQRSDRGGVAGRAKRCWSVAGRPVRRRRVQEFEFRSAGGSFVEDLDEIELVFDPGPDSRTVLAEVDRDEAQRRLQNAIQRHV